MTRAGTLTLLTLLSAVAPVGAQSARSSAIDAGDVATIVLQVPVPEGADSAGYLLTLDPGFRPFIATRGRLAASDEAFILPLTFATPARMPTGDVPAGRLELRIDGHEPLMRELVVRVRERREMDFRLDVEETTIPTDGVTSVPYRLYNRGNVVDTVSITTQEVEGWTLLNPARLVLEPGDSVSGGLRIAAPPTVGPGDRHLFVISAASGAGTQTRPLNLVVVSPSGWLGGLAHVPSSVFVGQAVGVGEGLVAALSGGGRVGPDTDVRLDLRYTEGAILDPALQRQVAGARLRVLVERPDLRLAAGDVYMPRNTLTGSFRQARGLDADYQVDERLSVGGFVAVPTGFTGEVRGGHILQARSTYATVYGEVGVLAGDMLQPGLGSGPTTRSTGAGTRWAGGRGPHSGTVEASLIRLAADDSIARAGPAVELDYRFDREWLSARLGARQVPGATTIAGGRGNERSASITARLLPAVHAVGWAYETEQNPLASDRRSTTRAANIGLRGQHGPLQLQVGGTLSDRSTLTGLDSLRIKRTTMRADASWTRGPLSLQGDAEIGTGSELGREGPYRALGAGLRWFAAGRSGWTRIQRTLRPGGLEVTSLQAGGRISAATAALTGGITRTVAGTRPSTALWTSAEIDLRRHLSLHLGASARPSLGTDDWSFSIGVRRRLNLPLPLARQPDLHGVIFDDANGNGRRDPEERPLEGVDVALGYLQTTTGADGRFSFRDATGAQLRIAPGGLPLGYLLPPHAVLPLRGEAEIPLVRSATLHLDLFMDRDEDGKRDPAESAAAGAVVVVTDERGRRRSVTADEEGRARVSGLMPGRYAVTAEPLTDRRRQVEPEVLMEVELAPGAEAHHTVAVPLRRRTIRMGGSDGGFKSR